MAVIVGLAILTLDCHSLPRLKESYRQIIRLSTPKSASLGLQICLKSGKRRIGGAHPMSGSSQVRGGRRVKIGQSEIRSVDQTDPVGKKSYGTDRPREWSGEAIEGLVRLAYRFVWNQADAEDAVHEAAVIAHRRRNELRDPNRWWSWVCSIVVRQCHLLGRRKVQRTRLSQGAYERRTTDEVAPPEEGDERGLDLVVVLQQLPRRQREVLVLRHIEGMEFAEIAEVLGMSAETARVHAMRGRESLVAKMNERKSHNAM